MRLVLFDLLGGRHPLKVVWRYATATCGALSVMTFGPPLMPMLLVGSWDSPVQVLPKV